MVILFPKFLLNYVNLFLFMSIYKFLARRNTMKEMLLCMIEPSYLEKYNYENLPVVAQTPENM